MQSIPAAAVATAIRAKRPVSPHLGSRCSSMLLSATLIAPANVGRAAQRYEA